MHALWRVESQPQLEGNACFVESRESALFPGHSQILSHS